MCSSSKGHVWWWIAALSVLAEILVFTAAQKVNVPSDLERNVARNRPCSQSSNFSEDAGHCEMALNGIEGEYPSDCIHTRLEERNSFFLVNIGPNIYIHKIIIKGRPGNSDRMTNMFVLLDGGYFVTFNKKEEKHTHIFNSSEVRKVEIVELKRFGIQSDPNSGVLNICEVYVYACVNDSYGLNCEKTCDSRCKRLNVVCDRLTGSCLECIDGKWGNNCTDACGAGCEETKCHRNGACKCRSHWMPPKCDVCNPGKWGDDCLNDCGEGCKDGVCNTANGHCTCTSTEMTPPLCGGCNPGKWGKNCENDCGAGCEGETCNKADGSCECQPGWGGTKCDECIDGKWGNNCSDACGEGCEETKCHRNGTCKCRSHWMPPKCDVCNPGKWGDDCLNDCGDGCKDGVCNKTNGHCNCTTAELTPPLCGGCNLGKWGKNCENDCGVGCEGETCKKDDGSCECQPGWVGTKCDGRPCECGEECTTSRKYIFADIPRKVNVAIGKPSKASTIKKIDNDDSCLANDGYLSTSELTTCMSTAEGDPNPFWEVDLGGNYEIAGINIDFDDDEMNLKSGISLLLDGKEIFVTNDQTTDPAYIPNNRRRNWTGQVLKLQRKGPRKDPLMICEVEVFNCLPGFFGYECEGICEKPVCDNARFCSRIDGSCQETDEVKETSDCSPLILVAGYVVGFLIISLFIFAAKVIPYKKKSKPTAVKKEAEGDKEEEKTEGEGSGIGGDKVQESEAESGETSETKEKESQV